MKDKDKKIIEDNMNTIEIKTRYLLKKYGIPQSEYEDYLQMACLAVCNKIHKYNGSVKFATFAGRIIENAFIDVYRADKRIKFDVVSLDEHYTEDSEGNAAGLRDFLRTDTNAENEVIANITNDIIRKCIFDAKSKCKAKTTRKGFEALELKFEGYSGAQIAKMFDAPSNSVRMWMSRAKKELFKESEFADLLKTI